MTTLKFMIPRIVGEIPIGTKVGLIDMGPGPNGFGGMLVKSEDSYVWSDDEGLDFAEFTLLSPSKGEHALKTDDDKYLDLSTLTAVDFVSFDLPPLFNVDRDKIYTGMRYDTSVTFIAFVPLSLGLYNIINNGVSQTASNLDILQIWSDSGSSNTVIDLIRDPKGKCLTGGWLDSNSSGCIFTDKTEADNGFFYRYSATENGCSNDGFGICLDEDKTCDFDYDPELKTNNLFPYSCDPKNPQPLGFFEKYETYFIIIGIVLLVIILVAVLFVIYVSSRRKRLSNQI